MTDHYRAKILSVEEGVLYPPTARLEHYLQDELLTSLDGDLGIELVEQTWSQFRLLLLERLRSGSPEDAEALLGRMQLYHQQTVDALRLDPSTLAERDLEVADFCWLSANLLAEAHPDKFPLVSANRVVIESAQIDDAWQPNSSELNGWHLKAFALRQLTEAHLEYYDRSPLYRYFDRFGDDSWAKHDFNGHEDVVSGIIWHADVLMQLELRSDDAFWQEHDESWWANDRVVVQRKSTADRETDYVTRYEALVHPSWVPALTSSAFWSKAY